MRGSITGSVDQRMQAGGAIDNLRRNVDTLIIIPNDRLLDVVEVSVCHALLGDCGS